MNMYYNYLPVFRQVFLFPAGLFSKIPAGSPDHKDNTSEANGLNFIRTGFRFN